MPFTQVTGCQGRSRTHPGPRCSVTVTSFLVVSVCDPSWNPSRGRIGKGKWPEPGAGSPGLRDSRSSGLWLWPVRGPAAWRTTVPGEWGNKSSRMGPAPTASTWGAAEGSGRLQETRFSGAPSAVWILKLLSGQLPQRFCCKIKMGAFPKFPGGKRTHQGFVQGTEWDLCSWDQNTVTTPGQRRRLAHRHQGTGLTGPGGGVAQLGSERPDSQQR